MLNRLKDITKDTMTYGFANMLGQIISFLLLPLYTIYLTPEDYGVVGMLDFILLFFPVIAALGISNAIFRRYNLYEEEDLRIRVLSTGALFVLFTSFLLLLVAFSFSESITSILVDDVEKYNFLTQIVFVSGWFLSMAGVFTVVLRAQRKVATLAKVRIAGLLITILCTIYLVVFEETGVWGVFIGGLIGNIVIFIALLILCRRFIKPVFLKEELKFLLGYGLPLFPHHLIVIGTNFLGQYLIKTYIGLAETGLYNIALKFALPLTFIVGSIQSAWVPIKFQIHREEKDILKRAGTFRQLISTYILTILILFLGLAFFAPDILLWVTPSEFDNAAFLVPFVLLIPFTRGIYFMSSTGFEFTNNTKPLPLVSSTSILVLAIIGFSTVQYLGIYGIITAIVVSWITSACMIRYFAIKRFYVPINYLIIILSLLSAFFIIGVVFTIQQTISNPFLRIGISTILTLIGTIAILGILINNKDFESLNLEKYPVLGKFNHILNFLKSKLKWSKT